MGTSVAGAATASAVVCCCACVPVACCILRILDFAQTAGTPCKYRIVVAFYTDFVIPQYCQAVLNSLSAMMANKENDRGNAYAHINRNPELLVFSPTFKAPAPAKVTVAPPSSSGNLTLLCAKFQDSLWIEFGNVPIRATKALSFSLKNPLETKEIKVTLDKASEEKLEKEGLTVTFGSQNVKEISIPASGTVSGTVFWSPSRDGSIREVAKLKMDGNAPLQLTIHGVAGTGQVRISY